ncbi:MAG: YfhO family protein [Candidatus Promineifilaceae bacterium]
MTNFPPFFSMHLLRHRLQSPLFRDLMAVVLLLVMVLLFLGRGLQPGKIWLPLDIITHVWYPWKQPDLFMKDTQNLLMSDPVNYIYPIKEFAAASIRQGEYPLWNPYILGGYPFTYNTQAGLLYPLSLIYYLWPAAAAVNIVITLQMFLGAVFMYLYLRLIVTRRLAALGGAILFTFNGLMIIWLEWQVVYAAIIWLPLQLYAVERMVRYLTAGGEPLASASYAAARRWAIVAGVALAIPWLGGHWNWTLYTSMTLGVYLLWRFWPLWRQAQDRRWRAQLLTLVALPLFIGLALSLVQVLPAFNYLRQSHRQPLTFGNSLREGLWNRFVVFLIPNFFGSPAHKNWWGPVPTNYAETTVYLGILPLLLAGLAPFLRRDNLTHFYLAWGTLGGLWALGTPVYGLLYVLPVFNGLLPSRAAILVVFSLTVLTAIALDRLLVLDQPTRQRLGRMVLGLMGVLLLIALLYFAYYRADVVRTWVYLRPRTALFLLSLGVSGGLLGSRLRGWLSPTLFGWLVLIWLAGDLVTFGYRYNPVMPVSDLYPATATTDFLQQEAELFRLTTINDGLVYTPNTSLVPRLTNLSGYEPGVLRRVVNYVNMAEGESAVRVERKLIPLKGLNSPLLDLLNVKYFVTSADWYETTPVQGVAQEPVTGWQPLTPGTSIGQAFTMPDAGLHRLDVSLQPTGEPVGLVTVRVFIGDGGQELAHATLDSAAATQAGWYSFYFEAFPSDWGRVFYFTVTFEGAGGELALGMSDPATAGVAFVSYYLPRPQLAYEDGKTRIYLNEGYFPRAFAVPQAILATNEEEALAALQTHANDLDQVVILEPDSASQLVSLSASQPVTLSASQLVTITHYGLNRVELTADMAEPGFVVLGDTYYPGWQATIDGEKTPVYRANSIVRAVYVPAGQHTITFTFRPPDFIIGAFISGLTLFGSLWLWLRNK